MNPEGEQTTGGPPTILSVNGLGVTFGGVQALTDVSLRVEQGSLHAIIGPNGAGKTTFFNAVSGLVPPTTGKILFRGEEIQNLQPERIARKGVVRTFQNLAVFGDLTVEQNLLLGRHIRTRAGWLSSALGLPRARDEQRRERDHVAEIAQFVGIDHVLTEDASTISYGDRKRLEIGRALCMDPAVLMLDEPVAGMNTTEKVEIRELVARVRNERGLTILLVEHDMGMVMSIAEHVTVLDFGRVVASGSPSAVQTDPRVIEAYLGAKGSKKYLASKDD